SSELASVSPLPAQTGIPSGAGPGSVSPEDRAKVSSLFGNLLMRQMFDPVLEPVVKGLQGSASGGGAMYGHLIKDALATALTQGGAAGLTAGIERQFYPAPTSRLPAAEKEKS
ncbi:MAG: hypothetical protein ACKODK_02760, partial [Opitutaceae bacterium]